jgi:Tol biopolymer transport system component
VIGPTIGPYEVLDKLGEGGMGEVYRARDTRLKRDVAIKVLPDSFATDPDRLARFHREAEVLAQLNHPNIAAVYGLEQSGSVTAIVLELIDGDTLADLTARGPLMLSALLPIARQVCEALEAAHEKGVIHRDLKPANIKVTPDGKVKVLDFGLATVVQPSTPQNINATHSPTLTLATQAGVILGTAAYMSPEQASGAIADKRADVWAFGVVLWEMLTGKRLFDGETVSHTLAFVLTKEPDWTTLPTNTPSSIRRLLRRCLEKDRKRRLPELATARMELDDALSAPAGEAPVPTVPPAAAEPRSRRMLPWSVATAAITALGIVVALWAPWRKVGTPPLVRVTTDIGADASLGVGGAPASNIALSADGKLLAYVASSGARATPQLFIRHLDQLQATPLSGTSNATNPFFSADGQWIAFFADGKLKKISATGGGAITLCDAPNGRGGSWGDDGTIVFAGNSTPGSGLLRVPEAGGKPETLTTPSRDGETLHRWPQLLRGGKIVLFTAAASAGSFGDANIVVETIPDGARKVVLRGGYFGRYLASGHLIYLHDSTLFAAPFDLDRLEITGQAFPVIEGVAASTGTGGVQLATSTSGTLAYLAGSYDTSAAPIVWMDRSGQASPLQSMASNWSNPQFSPDGTRLAIDVAPLGNGTPDVWIYDWARDTATRLTFNPGLDFKPVWTPDGKRIVFSSSRGDQTSLNLYWQRADGTGDAQRLTESKNNQFAASWSPDGRFLAFQEQNPQTGMDIMILPVDGDEASGWKIAKPTVFLSTMFAEQEPMFSPDGHWLAYFATTSGRPEVYVRPFAGPGGLQQISSGGGAYPMWSRTRPELFFTTFDNSQIMVASYTATGHSFRADKPRLFAPNRFLSRQRLRSVNVHPDGQRFAAAPAQDPQAVAKQDKLVLVFNFFDELKRLAPVGKN